LNTTESKDEDSKKIKGLLLSLFEITITGPFQPLISIEEREENH
jgi:hypothetical protein